MDQFKQRDIKIGEGRGGAFDGGCITVRPPALLPFGAYSVMENVKKWHPGISMREGMIKLATTNTGPGIMTLYQFSKGERVEIHTYAQNRSGQVIEFTNNPPTVTAGVFGSIVFWNPLIAPSTIPASWSDNIDILVYSDGVNQHQLFPGNDHKIGAFIAHDNATAITRIPEIGEDLTDDVLEDNGLFPTTALGNLVSNALFIMTPVPANEFYWKLSAGSAGFSTAGALKLRYINTSGNWALVSGFVDGTYIPLRAWSQSGSMTWTHPTDEAPTFMFGQSGYWYRLDFDGVAPNNITGIKPIQITYSGDWRPMDNVWDGVMIDVVEAQFYDQSLAVWDTFPASTINISLMTSADKLYLGTADPVYGFYTDVGATPNVTGTPTISVKKHNGTAFVAVTALEDQTTGFRKSGFISWQKDDVAKKTQLNGQIGYLYWYEISVSTTLSDNIIISALYLPQTYLAKDFGSAGICNSVWKNRSVFTSSIFDRDIYVSANGRPNVLNGVDFAILEPGDGRRNRTVCIKKFHNEIIAWQAEKGRDGGCTTLFEGYSPSTFGKLVLSSQVGTFNAKSAVVIDGATTTTKNDDKFQTMAYWISHYGIFMTDGRIVTMISQDIQNYFDTDFPANCIRRGYENEMWVEHDVDRGVLRFGLVTGPSATLPNTFPVFDLEDGTWSFDNIINSSLKLTCALQCEAATGQYPILHIGAGAAGGVFLLNTGVLDDVYAVNLALRLEMNHVGFLLNLREVTMRTGVENSGTFLKYVFLNGKFDSPPSETFSLVAVESGDITVRHRILERAYQETNISVQILANSTDAPTGIFLYDLNLDSEYEMNQ